MTDEFTVYKATADLINQLNLAKAEAAEWKRKYMEQITKTSEQSIGFPRVNEDRGGD